MTYRFGIYNIFGIGLLVLAYQSGLLMQVIEADKSHIIWIIAGLFLWGLWSCIKGQATSIRRAERGMVLMGLIGTIYGFIVATGDVDPAAAGDVSQVAGNVGQLIKGVNIALYTTLVGAVGAAWLMGAKHLQDRHE